MARLKRNLASLIIFLVAIIIYIQPVNAESNWELIDFEEPIVHDGYIGQLEIEPAIELWHYSGGYWGGMAPRIDDNDLGLYWNRSDKLANEMATRGYIIDFYVDYNKFPNQIKEAIDNGLDLSMQIEVDNTRITDIPAYKKLFNMDSIIKPQFRLKDDKLHIQATPRYNCYGDYAFKGVSKTIPQISTEYGCNVYAIYNRFTGEQLGRALGTNQLSQREEGKIAYQDIIPFSNGLLESGHTIELTDEDGKSVIGTVDSDIAQIGAGTFNSAGAVGLHFWYPMTIKFYAKKEAPVETSLVEYAPNPTAFSNPATVNILSDNFNTSEGIPTSEDVYIDLQTKRILARYYYNTVSGDSTYTVTVTQPYEMSDGSIVTTSNSYDVLRNYTYYTLAQAEVYSFKNIEVNNYALPDGKVNIDVSNNISKPQVILNRDSEVLSPSYISNIELNTISLSEDEQIPSVNSWYNYGKSYAENAVGEYIVKSDHFEIDGIVYLDGKSSVSSSPLPKIADGGGVIDTPTISNCIDKQLLKIDDNKLNGVFEGNFNVKYEIVKDYNANMSELNYNSTTNNVIIHTPVYSNITISKDNSSFNQKAVVNQSKVPLVLDQKFTISLSEYGSHKNIQGYGNRDYSKYSDSRQIQIPFDVYINNEFYEAGTSIRIYDDTNILTCYIPSWVDEGDYTITYTVNALNYYLGGNRQKGYNSNMDNYSAYDTIDVNISGRIFDFRITSIADPAWDDFFYDSIEQREHSSKVFYAGNKNQNNKVDVKREYYLPVMTGDNDIAGYQDYAVKKGYDINFDVKTMGGYYDNNRHLIVKPKYFHIDNEGKNRTEVDIYFERNDRYIKIGDIEKDLIPRTMILNDGYRLIGEDEIESTVNAILEYNPEGQSKENLLKSYTNRIENEIGYYHRLEFNNNQRTFVGNTTNLPSSIEENRSLMSIQKWYGDIYIPASALAVEKGQSLEGVKSFDDEIFFKDGYIIVNIEIYTVNEGEDQPILLYNSTNCNEWDIEGFDINKNGYELDYGDVVLYNMDKSSSDDYIAVINR